MRAIITEGDTSIDSNPLLRGEDPTDEPRDLPSEDIFDILSNQRRRYVLHYLGENGSRSDLRTLSEQVAAWENDVDPSQVTSKQRMRAYTALRQSHLPKMDRQGVVDFDAQSGAVRLTPAARKIETYLETVDGNPRPWCLYYLAVGTLGAVLFGATALGIGPLALVSEGIIGMLLALTVVVIGSLHTYEEMRSPRVPLDESTA